MKPEEIRRVWSSVAEILPYVSEPTWIRAELFKLIDESLNIKDLVGKLRKRANEQEIIKKTDLQIVANELEKLIKST